MWRSRRGLQIAGPRAFGYDLDYVPVEDALAVAPDLRIGIDVGGTHTDAVLLNDAHDVLGQGEGPDDGRRHVRRRAALDGVLGPPATPVAPERVTHVMLGYDPRDERDPRAPRLQKVAVLRLAAPTAWPCARCSAGRPSCATRSSPAAR